MLVEDIFSRDPLYVEDSAFLTKARQIIRDNHVRGLPVVNSQGVVLGIITTQDMLRVTSTRSNVTVAGYVQEVPAVTGKTPMLDAARLMLKSKSPLLPVVEAEERPVLKGVVTLLDVFQNLDLKKLPKKQICEIMSTKVTTASPDDPITRIWDKMVEEDFTGLPVVRDGRPIGMITRFDILKRGWARISKESDTRPVDSTQLRVEKLMSTPMYSLAPDASLASAIEIMLKHDVGRISVVEDGKLVGIVDRNDLIESYLG
ncbi:MAG: Inosine-5'-monophosphate dehydrogenase [Methanosaeta sp. PtaU1.Bin060]|jgi:CBS domain-containing protein|nr:MAG: Inosine-5'-monophosphate dehydrogenase [Methanosaeta sp. PtaU1.Bin060]